jgi:hypothetical protein
MSAKKRSKYLVTGSLCAALTMLIHATAVGANFFGLWSFYRQFNNGGIPVRTARVKGGKDSVLFRADHVYKGIVGAWLLHVTEKPAAGHCTVGPARWTPEFALGEKVGAV